MFACGELVESTHKNGVSKDAIITALPAKTTPQVIISALPGNRTNR